MDTELKKALIYGTAILVAAAGWSVSDYFKAYLNRYEIHSSGGAFGRTFLLDRRTGAAWRYYLNTDEKNKPIDEGFVLIHKPIDQK